jgi:hypothetical protein
MNIFAALNPQKGKNTYLKMQNRGGGGLLLLHAPTPFPQQAYRQIFKYDVTIYNYSPYEGNTRKETWLRRLQMTFPRISWELGWSLGGGGPCSF